MRARVLLTAILLAIPAVAWGQSYLMVVSGIAGNPDYAQELYQWATTLVDAAHSRLGLSESNIVYLAEDPDRDPHRIRSRSTKENVVEEIRELAARAGADADVTIVLLGHGSYRNGESRFNLPGPDLTAREFAELLGLFPTQQVAFVNTASASGAFIPTLSGERRVVVTATKSGNERNRTVFGRYFVEAFAGEGADTDKDQRVSLLEAFQYARSQVARAYQDQNRLLSEHAQLEDNGDGRGSTEPGGDAPDGALAQLHYLGGGLAAMPSDSRLVALYKEKEAIERRLAELRTEKDGLSPTVYEQRLEDLLVSLAQTSNRIREIERGSTQP